MSKRRASIVSAFAFCCVIASQPQLAWSGLVTVTDSVNFKRAVDSSRFTTLYDASTHPKRVWNLGVMADFERNPVEIGNPVGTRVQGVVNNRINFQAFGSYGFTDWFEAGLRVPFSPWVDYQGLPGTIARPNSDDIPAMGDIQAVLKFKLLDTKYVGLALVPYIGAPTGNSRLFNGAGTVTGGAKLAVHFDPHERVRIGFNVGYEAQDDVTILGTRLNDRIPLGAAVSIKAHPILDIIVEGHTEPTINNFFTKEPSTPAEATGELRFHATKNLDIQVGGGAGLTVGVGSPDFRAFLGLNYTRHREEEAPPPAPRAPEVKAKKVTIDQVVNFNYDKAVIKPESYGILNDVAALLKANPQISRVRIEGHTDSTGSDAYNTKLSQKRADSVKQYLISRGIDASRLESIGYGESKPVADNATASGRAQNRRTEFNVVEQ